MKKKLTIMLIAMFGMALQGKAQSSVEEQANQYGLLAYHTEPMASIVLWKLVKEDPVTFGNNRLRNCNIYAEKASLTYFKNEEVIFSLKINNRKWQLEQVNNLPEDLQQKYHIEDNYLDECDGLDLVMVATAFIKEYISRI